jgi:hypothetical protein
LKQAGRLVFPLLCVCWSVVGGIGAAAAADAAPEPRIEVRSESLLLVGVVHGDSMNMHLSRVLDNSPVRDAQVTVLLRGTPYPATAQVDGGYAISAKDLTLPGSAAIEFQITQGRARESLRGTLQAPEAAVKNDDQNGIRQYAWWILNFGVCIGVLVLFQRRRKAADD